MDPACNLDLLVSLGAACQTYGIESEKVAERGQILTILPKSDRLLRGDLANHSLSVGGLSVLSLPE